MGGRLKCCTLIWMKTSVLDNALFFVTVEICQCLSEECGSCLLKACSFSMMFLSRSSLVLRRVDPFAFSHAVRVSCSTRLTLNVITLTGNPLSFMSVVASFAVSTPPHGEVLLSCWENDLGCVESTWVKKRVWEIAGLKKKQQQKTHKPCVDG